MSRQGNIWQNSVLCRIGERVRGTGRMQLPPEELIPDTRSPAARSPPKHQNSENPRATSESTRVLPPPPFSPALSRRSMYIAQNTRRHGASTQPAQAGNSYVQKSLPEQKIAVTSPSPRRQPTWPGPSRVVTPIRSRSIERLSQPVRHQAPAVQTNPRPRINSLSQCVVSEMQSRGAYIPPWERVGQPTVAQPEPEREPERPRLVNEVSELIVDLRAAEGSEPPRVVSTLQGPYSTKGVVRPDEFGLTWGQRSERRLSQRIERMCQEDREKHQQLDEMRRLQEEAEEAECTYHPEINEKSHTIANQRGQDVVRRLMADSYMRRLRAEEIELAQTQPPPSVARLSRSASASVRRAESLFDETLYSESFDATTNYLASECPPLVITDYSVRAMAALRATPLAQWDKISQEYVFRRDQCYFSAAALKRERL